MEWELPPDTHRHPPYSLAWQGIAIGRLNERAMKQPDVTVNNAVTAVFEKYPVQSTARPAAGT